MQKLLRLILTSRVYESAVETPLEEAKILSEKLNNRVLLKREDLQPVFSFKIRGAYNKIVHLSERERGGGSLPHPPVTMPREWPFPPASLI